MAGVLSAATGNFLTAGTWGAVDATSYLNSESAVGTLTTSYVTSSTFTPGAITIDGIAIKLAGRLGVTGTISVALDLATVTVVGTEVTINVSDLPAAAQGTVDGGWILVKFAAPVLLVAATVYGVKAKTSSSSQVTLFGSTTSNWSRALRTTTTGAPAAGDDIIVAGEHTGAGTGNDITVTMDQTAATDYGSNTSSLVTPALAVCKRGTIKWKDTSAANPYLRLSGNAVVYNGGTLNIGVTGGSEIPRDSTAILEFDPAADGDMGLVARNGSTVNLQGLSRTSGKNVVSCKLNADTSTNLMQAVSISATALTAAVPSNVLDPTGTSITVGITSGTFNQLIASTDTAANSNHKYTWGGASVTNVTQVYTQWVKRGSGTNNRYIRLQLATATTLPATNGFYADFDLQAGTVGACTALGNGTATSASITAFGGGFICTIIGKISSAAGNTTPCIGACNASGVVSYAGDATQNFLCSWPQVYTASAQPTDLTVDTDTGWLSGDVVAIASTTRTANECEIVSLNGNAGASTLTCNLYPVNFHSGTSPTQAEVILLTRNVKVRSTSPTIMAYVNFIEGSTFDVDWTEFYYLGDNATGKRGVEISSGTTNSINGSIQYSSIHDVEDGGIYLFSTAGAVLITSLTFAYTMMWNLATVALVAGQVASAITPTNYTIDNNILIRTGTGNGWTLSDIGGTFTNNVVVGAASVGINPAEQAVIGVMSGNVAHSNGGAGASFASAGLSGAFGTFTGWRNAAAGVTITSAVIDFTMSPTLFGNTTDNLIISATGADVLITNSVLNGDTTFSTTNGIRLSASAGSPRLVVDNGDLSTVAGIKTAHTNDINVAPGFGTMSAAIVLRNTKLGAATEVATPSNLGNNGFVSAEKLDQTAGNHKTWMKNGTVQTDTTFFNNASPSMRMTPTSTSLKLESASQFQGIEVALANGATGTVSVYVRKSAAGDGAAYNGNQPRLIVKANPAIGIASDTVLATYSAGTGAWNQISGVSPAVTDDGVIECVVDCDGTAGWINVDDWAVA